MHSWFLFFLSTDVYLTNAADRKKRSLQSDDVKVNVRREKRSLRETRSCRERRIRALGQSADNSYACRKRPQCNKLIVHVWYFRGRSHCYSDHPKRFAQEFSASRRRDVTRSNIAALRMNGRGKETEGEMYRLNLN